MSDNSPKILSLNDKPDFSRMRIQGVNRKTGMHLDIPLASEIDENLWVGGYPQGAVFPYFKLVVAVHAANPYGMDVSQVSIQTYMEDKEGAFVDNRKLFPLAEMVHIFSKEEPVLIHSLAGLNRAAYIAGLVLRLRGKNSAEAIQILQDKRSLYCLSNPTYYGELLAANNGQAVPKIVLQ